MVSNSVVVRSLGLLEVDAAAGGVNVAAGTAAGAAAGAGAGAAGAGAGAGAGGVVVRRGDVNTGATLRL